MIGIDVTRRSKQSVWSMANFYLHLSPELTQISSFIVNEDSETAKEKNYIRIRGAVRHEYYTWGDSMTTIFQWGIRSIREKQTPVHRDDSISYSGHQWVQTELFPEDKRKLPGHFPRISLFPMYHSR